MIHIVIGTRAEAIKMAPVILALKKKKAQYKIIGTGQHRVEGMLENFGIDDPVDYIIPPPERGSVSKASMVRGITFSIDVMRKIHRKAVDEKPDWILYHGDTMTTAAAAIGTNISWGKPWKTGHVEAGLRSRVLWEPFPEEISRIIADHLSDVLFAPTEWAERNLQYEGITRNVYVTGNTSVDAVKLALERARSIEVPWDDYILVNIHRFENIKSRKRLTSIVSAVEEIAKNFDGNVVWPMHSTTERMLRTFDLWERVNDTAMVTESLPYLNFVKALSKTRVVLTDGGSIQEESVTLKIPAVILRKRTERPEGLKTPYNYLVGTDGEKIVRIVLQILENPPKWEGENPYGDGRAGERIAEVILHARKR